MENLSVGVQLQAKAEDGKYYLAEVLQVSAKRRKAPVKVKYCGYDGEFWLPESDLRSKLLPSSGKKEAEKNGDADKVNMENLSVGVQLQAKAEDGKYYLAEVLHISTKRRKAPVKVKYCGYDGEFWLPAADLRSKLLRSSGRKQVDKTAKMDKTDKAVSDIGIIGSGVMGSNLGLNIADKFHDGQPFQVSLYDLSQEQVQSVLAANAAYKNLHGFGGKHKLKDFVASLKPPRKAIILVPAGAATDAVIEDLAALFRKNDIIIDVGNANFRDQIRRAESLEKRGLRFLGMGVSGGAEGARKGPAFFPGGTLSVWNDVKHIIEAPQLRGVTSFRILCNVTVLVISMSNNHGLIQFDAPQPCEKYDCLAENPFTEYRKSLERMTAVDGPFPLAEEDVQHYGTSQRYRCWQKGPNSIVHHTLRELYGDCFARYSDKEFLVYEGERFTFSQAMEISVALSRALRHNYGVQRGSCVAIAGRNFPEWVFTFVAVTSHLGAVALPVNAWWTGNELKYGLEDSQSCLLVADMERLERAPFISGMGIPAVCMRAGSTVPPHGAERFEEVVIAGQKLQPLNTAALTQDDRAMLMYTSGTTGMPKGVVSTHRNICSALNTLRMYFVHEQPLRQLVVILAVPLFHVTGSHIAMLAAICRGDRLILMYKWNATRALQLIQEEKVNSIVGVPTNTYELVNHPDFKKFDTSSMTNVGGGGAAFAAPMIKRVRQTFEKAKAGTGYGLTETNAVSVIMPAVCILGEGDAKMPPGGVGEICLRGPAIMQEYWRKPDRTAEAFHVDEHGELWFRTGDIGAVDEDDFVYIMDRAKDIIIRGGENISANEVETALYEHPDVAEVAAVGMPDDALGETVAAAIVFRKGKTPPKEDELRAFAAQRLPRHMVPKEFFSWPGEALPRGATEKIQKRAIRADLAKLRKGPDTASKL
ncbi:lcfA [Symbiodinium sp. CCMP2456]|nr:lcfA [Symbiodinium sp. CCMP2456]